MVLLGRRTPAGVAGSGQPVLLWFRRDLRVADNPALQAALAAGSVVIPVYVWAPEEEGQFQPGRCSRWWLASSLRSLDEELRALGSRLVFRRAAESRQALVQLAQEVGASALFFNHLYDPISLVRDNEVKAAMAAMAVHCQSFNADVLYEPWEVLNYQGQPFTNFEDYWSRVVSMPYQPPVPLPVPTRLPPVPTDVEGLDRHSLGLMTQEEELSNQQLEFQWVPGSKGAHKALQKFVLAGLERFSNDRAKTDRESTSALSPHVHCGEISVRHIYYVSKQKEVELVANNTGGKEVTSCRDFLRQMGFREYARYLSFHFPFTHERSLLEHLRACPWKFDQRLFKAWRQGRTGYPLVDAGMRQLWSTGWLHNRSRVVCASFLVKNLLLPWQWGLKHYWDALLDADLECDALGWQYCSGCLADAHPFNYIIDHAEEAKRYDPTGHYVRRWLPVLARLPMQWIHRPWEAPEHVLQDAGVELGVNYPYPVVSLQESEAHVAHAVCVIEQSLAWTQGGPAPAIKAPYRPPSSAHPGDGGGGGAGATAGLNKPARTPSSVQGPPKDGLPTAAHARPVDLDEYDRAVRNAYPGDLVGAPPAGAGRAPAHEASGGGGGAKRGVQARRMAPPLQLGAGGVRGPESDEEVVSNTVGDAAMTEAGEGEEGPACVPQGPTARQARVQRRVLQRATSEVTTGATAAIVPSASAAGDGAEGPMRPLPTKDGSGTLTVNVPGGSGNAQRGSGPSSQDRFNVPEAAPRAPERKRTRQD